MEKISEKQIEKELKSMDQRLYDLEEKMTSIDTKLTQVVDAILGNALTKTGGFVAELAELKDKIKTLETKLEKQESFKNRVMWTVGVIVAIGVNYLYLVIAILVSIILLQRCNSNKPITSVVTKIKVDTAWVKHDSFIYSKPKIVTVVKGVPEIQYKPDPSYDKLVIQYKELVDLCTAKNIYSDTLKIDSIGYVNVMDTISKNKIQGRRFRYELKHPIITKTITLQAPPKTQLYIGGGLQGNQYTLLNQFNAGLLLKTKQDQIYGVYTGIDTDGRMQYGLQSYWKIKLHK